MKLSKLYSNSANLFEPTKFRDGLNVVLAHIRLPENRNKDTHNLGKSTLGRLINFCLLSKRDPSLFLFKYEDLFTDFVFFLELELIDGSYVTVRRSVSEPTKIGFKRHESGDQDFSDLEQNSWDHSGVAFERAKEILDGILDLRALKPWEFRNAIGYLLRSQDDYHDVFNLNPSSKHAYWKPFLAHILGFRSELLVEHYAKEEELKEATVKESNIKSELGGSVQDISKVEGLLLLKQDEASKKQALADAFDFRKQDKDKTKQLVDDIDRQISELNSKRYTLTANKKKIVDALKEGQILFDPEEAKELFGQAGVFFEGQIKKDFEQLIQFNRAITEERRSYLAEELKETETEISRLGSELNSLGKHRSSQLAFLGDTDVFNKFKRISDELVSLRADIATLERQKEFLHRLQSLRAEIRKAQEERNHLQTEIEADVEAQNADDKSLFSSIRLYFNEIIEEVIAQKALLSVSPNREGHLEFSTDIIDDFGRPTSAGEGYSYHKLLCVGFDFAILRAHLDQKFPRFVYHDGIFESLDDRKKENLLRKLRQYADLGLQSIITVIDSDLPVISADESAVFDATEIILTLHDEGPEGRLFKMQTW